MVLINFNLILIFSVDEFKSKLNFTVYRFSCLRNNGENKLRYVCFEWVALNNLIILKMRH